MKNNKFYHSLTNINSGKRSRHIPASVEKELLKRHYFECAWDCTPLYDKHHIVEFAEGGEHSIENLILLCPNCHRQVHEGVIPIDELLKRKSTHLRGDRHQGLLLNNYKEARIRLGGAEFLDVTNLLVIENIPLVSVSINNDYLYLSTRFYNKQGELIFWMSNNIFWAPSSFKILLHGPREIEIKDETDADHYLRIWDNGKILCVEGNNFFKGFAVTLSEDSIELGKNKTKYSFKGGYYENFQNGIMIDSD